MEQRHIGGLQVSALALGTMYFGTQTDEDTAFALLDRFHAAGGTLVDTANCYNQWLGEGGESEAVIGRWLASRGHDMVIASKVGCQTTVPGKPVPDYFQGLGADVIRGGAVETLRNLGRDHIDLYYAHFDDRDTPLEETVDAFAGLVESGKVRALGASNQATWRIEQARALARAAGRPGYTAVQQKYTYLWTRQLPAQTDQASDELLDYASSQPDVQVLAYTPLLKGAYVRSEVELPLTYDHPSNAARLRVLREVAADLGLTPNQVVLAWMMRGRPAVIPIIGASSVEQLDELLGAADVTLAPEIRDRLDAAGQNIGAR
ncbi:aldo/keto reductase [Actinoplanes sp. NEAU-A12]|uniref:Aldo/keto reductase n=1 Tax=Actinoplanes sandaracinus TaxID=3045177 RepID=A0ABT6WI28_9ACTN|nr:aldo/keto reductase [Actinoplanes sandaracinus]MDI6099387.1 aldo/keto reductase [Actinoplanes sandaracinus]